MKQNIYLFLLFCLMPLSLSAQEKNRLWAGVGVNITSSDTDLYKPSFGPLLRVEYERTVSDWFSMVGHLQSVSNRMGEYQFYSLAGIGAQALFRPFSGFFHRLNLGVATGLEYGEHDRYIQRWEDPETRVVELNKITFQSGFWLNFGPVVRFDVMDTKPLSASVFVHPHFYYDPIDKYIKCWFVNVGVLCGLGF